MSAITINGKQYEARALTQEQYDWYQGVLIRDAQSRDQPLARFLRKIDGVEGDDRKAAIAAFVSRPDWDVPLPVQIREAAVALDAVIVLTRLACEPKPSYDDCRAHITDPVAFLKELHAAMKSGGIDAMLEKNRALKERLAGKKAGDTDAPEGESPCSPA